MPNRDAKMFKTAKYRGVNGRTSDVVLLGKQSSAPVAGDFTVTPSASGGTLATDTYSYRVTAVVDGIETAPSVAETAAVTGPTGSVTVDFTVGLASFPTATAWKVYGRSDGTELLMGTITAPTATFVDDGSVTPSGALPADNAAIRFRDFGTKSVRTQVGKATTEDQTNVYYSR